MLRIGLDIDDVLGDFMGWYKRRFECDKYPHRLKEHIITRNVQKILRTDKSFWIGLPVISKPDFEPTLYCTKRVNPKKWTKLWLRLNNFPDKPVYQLFSQSGNKADLIKGRVDVFIDDSEFNVRQMNAAGVPTLIFRKQVEGLYTVNSLSIDEISETYNSMQKWKSA